MLKVWHIDITDGIKLYCEEDEGYGKADDDERRTVLALARIVMEERDIGALASDVLKFYFTTRMHVAASMNVLSHHDPTYLNTMHLVTSNEVRVTLCQLEQGLKYSDEMAIISFVDNEDRTDIRLFVFRPASYGGTPASEPTQRWRVLLPRRTQHLQPLPLVPLPLVVDQNPTPVPVIVTRRLTYASDALTQPLIISEEDVATLSTSGEWLNSNMVTFGVAQVMAGTHVRIIDGYQWTAETSILKRGQALSMEPLQER